MHSILHSFLFTRSKKMKRILALILTILLVLCTFTACGNNKSKETAPQSENIEKSNEESETQTDETLTPGCTHTGGTATCKTKAKCATCGEEYGELKSDNHEGVLEWSKTAETHKRTYNCCGAISIEQTAHSYKYAVCEICEYVCTHKFSNGKCSFCDITLYNLNKDTKKITFGSYPQTKVTDQTLSTTLNTKAGNLPTAENSQGWTSYGYYISSSNEIDYMWYIDIIEGGEKYRGVYFTSYRPNRVNFSSSTSESSQDDNGYLVSTDSETHIYWFKYEPICWTILSTNEANGTALILCDMIIDSQAYQDEYRYDTENGKSYNSSENIPEGTYANNYKYSTIRKWLNETFYETAFNTLQKALVIETNVDNSVESTGYTTNDYACEDTKDKVFLLSYKEATNADYGLNTTTVRQKKTTDYAQAQGALMRIESDYPLNGSWWLRSISYNHSDYARAVYNGGDISNDGPVMHVGCGVVPVLQIQLN